MMIFCVGNAKIIASIYPTMATVIPHWWEFVTIKATVPKNKASDGAGNAATVKRRIHIVSLCWVMVKSNIKVAETRNDKMARKNRSLNNIFASRFLKEVNRNYVTTNELLCTLARISQYRCGHSRKVKVPQLTNSSHFWYSPVPKQIQWWKRFTSDFHNPLPLPFRCDSQK